MYWGLRQKTYRAAFGPTGDPDSPGKTAGRTPAQILAPCPRDITYDASFSYPQSRPVHGVLARVSLTGKIERPLLTLHGTLDTLLPISVHGDVYARMIANQPRDRLHRYCRLE